MLVVSKVQLVPDKPVHMQSGKLEHMALRKVLGMRERTGLLSSSSDNCCNQRLDMLPLRLRMNTLLFQRQLQLPQ
jgi:hypothetical protein